MKYLEELESGDCFKSNGKYFVLTSDFKPNGSRLCFSLNNGFPNWIKSDEMIELTDLFTMDQDSNIIAIKERKSQDVSIKSTDIP